MKALIYKIIIMSVVSVAILPKEHSCLDYGIKRPSHYQDIVVNGKVVCSLGWGQKSETRCEAIEKIISLYQRPVTVLDIGAAEGYFALKLAPKFPSSTFVMIEEGNSHLLDLCKINNLKNIIFLNKHMDLENLRLLGQCEHFDIVITLNVLHHFGAQHWKTALDYILDLGEKIIIETPPVLGEDTSFWGDIDATLQRVCTKVLCKVPRWNAKNRDSITYLVERKKKDLQRTFFGNQHPSQTEYHIDSDYKKKSLRKRFNNIEVVTEYKPGINLVTFRELNGVFPLLESVKNSLLQQVGIAHSDCKPYNFIIQGDKVVAIDTHDPRRFFYSDNKAIKEEHLAQIIEFLSNKDIRF